MVADDGTGAAVVWRQSSVGDGWCFRQCKCIAVQMGFKKKNQLWQWSVIWCMTRKERFYTEGQWGLSRKRFSDFRHFLVVRYEHDSFRSHIIKVIQKKVISCMCLRVSCKRFQWSTKIKKKNVYSLKQSSNVWFPWKYCAVKDLLRVNLNLATS